MGTKSDQIIIRLSSDKKEELQKIADLNHIAMSELIRIKIDEIIEDYKLYGIRAVNDEQKFMKEKKLRILDKNTVEELREEFKKALIVKMKKEIEEADVRSFLFDDDNTK